MKVGSVNKVAATTKSSSKFDMKDFANKAIKHFQRAEMGPQSAQLAYYVLLALFPILLALGNIIPLLPIPTDQVLQYVEMGVPAEVSDVLLPILKGYLEGGSGGVVSIGIIVSIWPASKAFNVFQKVLNKVYDAKVRKNFIFARIFSFLTAILMISMVGVVAFIFVFGKEILQLLQNFFPINLAVISTFESLRWVVTFGILMLIMAFVYYFVPNVKWPFKFALPGAVFTTIGFLLVSQLFSLYISFVGKQAPGSGAVGVFIVLMIWLYLLGNVFILGGIINVIFYDYKHEDALVVDEKKTYLSVLYSKDAKEYTVNKQILRKTLVKQTDKIKEQNLPGQSEIQNWSKNS